MSLGTSGGSDKEKCKFNLPCRHLYTLLDVQTVVSNDKSKQYRLYKFRNPWKVDYGFSGAWNDTAKIWKADGETYDQ